MSTMIMCSLEELTNFLKSLKKVDTQREDHDSCGNVWSTEIYSDGTKFYKVEFLNDYPLEYHNKLKHIYYPVEVVQRKTRVVEEVYYE